MLANPPEGRKHIAQDVGPVKKRIETNKPRRGDTEERSVELRKIKSRIRCMPK
jgi:hypothetical protein